MSANVTPELVGKAYDALASGDPGRVAEYWAEDMVWLVPGHNQLSGGKHGRDEVLHFMQRGGELSGGSFPLKPVTGVKNEEDSLGGTKKKGGQGGGLRKKNQNNGAHVLRV